MVILLRNFKNIFLVADLRKKLFITFGSLAAYRLVALVPIPVINSFMLSSFLQSGATC